MRNLLLQVLGNSPRTHEEFPLSRRYHETTGSNKQETWSNVGLAAGLQDSHFAPRARVSNSFFFSHSFCFCRNNKFLVSSIVERRFTSQSRAEDLT